MKTHPTYLVDEHSTRIAVLHVEAIGDRYRGTIALDEVPQEIERLFTEFEENVEGQMFTLADEIEEKIRMLPLKIIFPNGTEAYPEDLQVYPSTKRVSFTIRERTSAAS